jgi:hypothetical protein
MYDPASDNRHQLEALLGKIRERREALERQLLDIRAMQSELDEAESRCLSALSG